MSRNFATVAVSPYITAHGKITERGADGMATVDTGLRQVTGRIIESFSSSVMGLCAGAASTMVDDRDPEYA